MEYDEMELDMLGDQRTAMFVIISDTDDTFNFVVAIMYTQLFNLLCDKADVLLLIVIMAGKELYMVVSGCLVIRKTGKVHGADWHGKIVTFLLYGTAAVHIIWFHITPMVSDLLIGLCAIMMVISVALYIIQNTRTLKGETV